MLEKKRGAMIECVCVRKVEATMEEKKERKRLRPKESRKERARESSVGGRVV